MRFLVAFLNRLLTSPFGQAAFGIWLAKHKRLCAELIWRAYRDQRARNLWLKPHHRRTVKQLQEFIQLDLANSRRLKQIVAQYGWPGQSLVGPIGGQAAWLLAQHSGHDTAFQK